MFYINLKHFSTGFLPLTGEHMFTKMEKLIIINYEKESNCQKY